MIFFMEEMNNYSPKSQGKENYCNQTMRIKVRVKRVDIKGKNDNKNKWCKYMNYIEKVSFYF